MPFRIRGRGDTCEWSSLQGAISKALGFPGSAVLEISESVSGVSGVGDGSDREVSREQSRRVVGRFSWLL